MREISENICMWPLALEYLWEWVSKTEAHVHWSHLSRMYLRGNTCLGNLHGKISVSPML